MAKSSNGNSRDYYSFGAGMRGYLYNVARIYDIIREGCTFSNGKGEDRVEFAIEGEGKKLFALYLAAGIEDKYFYGIHEIYSSDAYDILFSAFFKSNLYKSKSKNISQDDASRIISQEFSDLLSDLDNNSSYSSQMLVKQTLKVAKAKETNPIYQMCKIYDGSGKNKLTDSYVSSLYDLYKAVSKKSVIFPLTREAFEKKVSIEAKKKSSKKTITETAGEKVQAVENDIEKSSIFGMLFGNGTSTKRIRQETEPFQQDRKNGVVEHGKLNKEAGAESKRVAEFHKSFDDHLRTMTEIVSEGEKKIMPDIQRHMREEFGIDPTQLSSDVTNSPKQDKQGSKVEQTVEDNTEAVQEYSDEEIKEHIRKLDEEREKRIKLLNQQEQDRAREFRQFQSRLNEAARPIQQSTVAHLDKLLTQIGEDTSKFRTGTAGFKPGTSDLGEMGKMFGDKSIGDTSKSDDKGRHL